MFFTYANYSGVPIIFGQIPFKLIPFVHRFSHPGKSHAVCIELGANFFLPASSPRPKPHTKRIKKTCFNTLQLLQRNNGISWESWLTATKRPQPKIKHQHKAKYRQEHPRSYKNQPKGKWQSYSTLKYTELTDTYSIYVCVSLQLSQNHGHPSESIHENMASGDISQTNLLKMPASLSLPSSRQELLPMFPNAWMQRLPGAHPKSCLQADSLKIFKDL